MSACPKCENGFFEIKTVEPKNAKYKQNFVQCTMCGSVVGVLDFLNIGAMTESIEEEVRSLGKRLGGIERALAIINRNLAVLERAIKSR